MVKSRNFSFFKMVGFAGALLILIFGGIGNLYRTGKFIFDRFKLSK